MDIGEMLKERRLQKGFSLEEISAKTNVHINVLEDIEADRIGLRFSPIYIKGFLRTYSKYLDLNPDEIVSAYLHREMTAHKKQVLGLGVKKFPANFSSKLKRIFKLLVILCIVVLPLFYIKRAFQKIFSAKSPVLKVEATQKKVVETQAVVKVRPKLNIPLNEMIDLLIVAKEDAWMRVKSNGKVIFQNVLRKGKSERWVSKEGIELWVGNGGGIEIFLNGEALGSPGKRGEVLKRILIGRQGMKVINDK